MAKRTSVLTKATLGQEKANSPGAPPDLCWVTCVLILSAGTHAGRQEERKLWDGGRVDHNKRVSHASCSFISSPNIVGGPYCVSDVVLGFDNIHRKSTHPAVEVRLRKTNKAALEVIHSGHRNSVSIGLAWGANIF